ncbi:MAG TPA: hypothetical protein VKA73_15335 [Rubrobacter sp.]|nr:hypothetical protein [Rubrobacter sp.]
MNGGQGQQSTDEGAQRKPAYGFLLVLAAIVVVAIMYSVTLLLIDNTNRAPELVFGAMAASFTVIGTLVGTYFGIKAGLDGQDRVKDAISRASGGRDERPLARAQRDGDRANGKLRADESSGGTGETRVVKGGGPDGRQEWDGGSV